MAGEASMAGEPVISVRGEAFLEADPEVAAVTVTVMARDKDRGRVVRLISERTSQVASLVKGYGDGVEDLRSHPVHVNIEFKEGKPRERVAGYVATAGFSVNISDFSITGELIARLAGEDMVSVAGPNWLLRPASPVYRQARTAAAQDALQRARDYAQAFGAQVIGLIEVADTGLLTEQHEPPRMFARAARAVAAPEPEAFDLEPAKQTVRAQIEARFTMTPPAFGSE